MCRLSEQDRCPRLVSSGKSRCSGAAWAQARAHRSDLSNAGDVFLLWLKEGALPGWVAFLLAHLAYIAAFCVPVRLAAKLAELRARAVVHRVGAAGALSAALSSPA